MNVFLNCLRCVKSQQILPFEIHLKNMEHRTSLKKFFSNTAIHKYFLTLFAYLQYYYCSSNASLDMNFFTQHPHLIEFSFPPCLLPLFSNHPQLGNTPDIKRWEGSYLEGETPVEIFFSHSPQTFFLRGLTKIYIKLLIQRLWLIFSLSLSWAEIFTFFGEYYNFKMCFEVFQAQKVLVDKWMKLYEIFINRVVYTIRRVD